LLLSKEKKTLPVDGVVPKVQLENSMSEKARVEVVVRKKMDFIHCYIYLEESRWESWAIGC